MYLLYEKNMGGILYKYWKVNYYGRIIITRTIHLNLNKSK